MDNIKSFKEEEIKEEFIWIKWEAKYDMGIPVIDKQQIGRAHV